MKKYILVILLLNLWGGNFTAHNSSNINAKKVPAVNASLIEWRNNSTEYAPNIPSAGQGFITGYNSTIGSGLSRSRHQNNYQVLTGISAVNEQNAITNNEYVEYRVRVANSGLEVRNIGYFSPNTTPDTYSFSVRMSTDNFATSALVHPTRVQTSIGQEYEVSLPNPLYLKANTEYTFRVYFYNVNGGQNASIGHDDFKLIGFVGLDSDGDGIPDEFDLDDDNDGILDVTENCNPYLAQNISGAWKGKTTSNLTVNLSSNQFQDSISEYNDLQHKYHVNQSGATQRVASSGNITYTYTFSPAVPANEIAFFLLDLDPGQSNISPTYQFRVNGGTNNYIFKAVPFNSSQHPNDLTFEGLSGNLSVFNSGLDDYKVLLKGVSNQLVSQIRITSAGIATGDLVAYSLFALNECDTDGDGIPNRLDLDSDADGCSDAFEGGANIIQSQLMVSGGILSAGSTSILQNICTTCVSTNPVNLGVPQLVTLPDGYNNTTGQTVGDSQNNAVQTCYCTQPGSTQTGGLPTKVGITLQQKQTAWPENIPNGHIALESKEKGFVITRVAHVSFEPQPTDSVTNPLAGMLVYDIEDGCVKLFNGINWKCIERSCNNTTN